MGSATVNNGRKIMKQNASLAAVAMLATLLCAPAMAQAEQPAAPKADTAPLAEQNGQQLSDEKLDKAAAAVGKVVALKQRYMERYAAADDTDRPKIADEAQTELKKAVTDQGLSVEEYDGIMQVAQNDTSVREKLLDRLKAQGENEEL